MRQQDAQGSGTPGGTRMTPMSQWMAEIGHRERVADGQVLIRQGQKIERRG